MPNHVSSNRPNLVVYKASAGSGKTHQLTGEYLNLLFSAPYAYRHILAVTFTNKATDEMKSRIVNELANLAADRPSTYISQLFSTKYDSEEKIREQARSILNHILHDYSAFSVSTIDRFFQQTMRAFTRELGLNGGYNIELDTNKVLTDAIDAMLYDLEKRGNKDLLEWLIRFSEEKIENGETWNIKNDIRSLSFEIFKENYKASANEVQSDIRDKTLMEEYKKMLRSIIADFERQSQQIADKALNIMLRHSLKPEEMKGGSRSPFNSFFKWANGEVKEPTLSFVNLQGEVSGWYTKTTPNEVRLKIETAYNSGLHECVCEMIMHYVNNKLYHTAFEINRYFFTLGILGDVDRKIRELAAENNTMHISDTTELLNKIIKDTDSPFIYEKIGTHINHYMIDEFQDTSNMQWINFSPLIKDSLASGNRNLIVGDVKQSIYRWRNSDWKLLDEQLDIDFHPQNIDHQSLDVNRRSLPNVVNFNNAIFTVGARLLQNYYNHSLTDSGVSDDLRPYLKKIVNAYKGSYQYLPPQKRGGRGHVRVEFINREEYSDWQQKVLEEIPRTIEQLQDKGYSLKDIAILVRTKKEGADIANRLLEYKGENTGSKYRYDLISDEALYLSASKSIKLILSLLRYLQTPDNVSLKTLAVYEYYKFKEQLTSEEALNSYFSKSLDFPNNVVAELERIRELSLYEMTEEIFNLFHDAMEGNENLYIQSFLDMVLDFTTRITSDLDSFLKWWDETGSSKTIFTPDGQDAIRIMTIHKSKGLGFNVVLLPFCNWEIDHKLTTILWCKPQYAPFDRLHLVPVRYSKNLRNTIFEKEYYDERLHAFVDNLNILYVAFTRAEQELIVFTPKSKESEEIGNISSLLWQCIHNTDCEEDSDGNMIFDLSEHFYEEEDIFELGEGFIPQIEGNSFIKDEREVTVDMLTSIPFEDRLHLFLKNKYYFANSGQRDYGTMMHDILSRIYSLNDLEEAVRDYFRAGEVSDAEADSIFSKLQKYLSEDKIQEWYSGKYRILNEVEILLPKGNPIRPDRVMISEEGEVIVVDYKFGELESKKYQKQVKYYTDQICKMGYTHVQGFIWYLSLEKVVEVL